MKRRAFVLDPVCALPYGHNLVGLKYFSDAIKPFYETVVPIACRDLAADIASKYCFEREFSFYYHEHIKLGAKQQNGRPQILPNQFIGDARLRLAVTDTANIFNKYLVDSSDSLVFPCADYYGAMAVLEHLLDYSPDDAPTIFFRFIGVMENATSMGLPGLSRLMTELKKLLRGGYKIKTCAETPRYANNLAKQLNSVVSVVPYPTHSRVVKKDVGPQSQDAQEHDEFVVVCPGSARLDKGYLALQGIFSAIRQRDPSHSVKFVTQSLPVSDALQHSRYTNQLYAIPGVLILPSTISEAQMNELYLKSDLVILPYDPLVYDYRGSAVFMECISRGIPVVALGGCAFSEQISYYGAGSIVAGIEDFADAILKYRQTPKDETHASMTQARHRYSIDADLAFNDWIMR
jgi:glycosyltransferase involved in cell wall biosynthesis